MDFRQFRYFVTTAEELHMARAAERLGIAQPALSQQIKSLETQLGTRLFLRTKRRIELTDAGLALFQEARNVLEHAERAVRLARDIGRGEAGHIDIGIVGSAMFDRPFPLLLTSFRKERPEVRLAVHELPILQQIEALPNRGLDIAIVRSPLPQVLPDEVDHFVLSRQRLLVAIPLSHPLAKTPSISLSDLADDDFLSFLDPEGIGLGHDLLVFCRQAGFTPRITQHVTEVGTMVSLIAAGFGVSLLADILTPIQFPGVCYVPLRQAYHSQLVVVHRRFERSAAVQALIDGLRSIARPGTQDEPAHDTSVQSPNHTQQNSHD